MNSNEKAVVKSLEERLNSLDIDDDGNEPKSHGIKATTTGWQSKENLADLKEQFKDLVNRAKQVARYGNLEESLTLYQKAYKIHKSQKVSKRIEKLQRKLEEWDNSSNDDDDDDDDDEDMEGFKLPKKIYNKLYSYQIEGVMWFWKLYEEKKGGILGDDMGLGKTIQVISFLAGMFRSGHIKTVLIIMPVSLLSNWEKEFRKWAPEIRVVLFHGSSMKQRSENVAKIQSRNGVCLTTYGLACTCSAQFCEDKYGDRFIWDYIILDEGHKIKNTANKTTIAIRAISAENHFILTGTPIQNNLREMWALFDFVCQGQLLGTSRSFKNEYEQPIVRARERDATAYEKRMGQEMSAHLRELIAPHFLRRTKDILEQTKKTITGDGISHDNVDGGSDKENEETNGMKKPKLTRKNDFIIWLYLSQTQLQIYEDFIKLDRVKEILMTTKSPLAELNVLKKICDHPRLLSTMACRQLGLNDELDNDDTDCKYEWCSPPVEQLVEESGKLVFLLQLLVKLKSEGHRTLVFSQSRKMLDIIQKVLKDKEIKMIRIDGTIDNIERTSRVDAFQTDKSFSVFLLTTQVGGVGLTLTAADRVVIFDPSWNPATDAQAVDRAYRIGQKKTVVIYRLITCGSLEEKIYRKQVFKQAITKQTTGSSINPFRYFSRHELRELFVLDDHRSSKTQIQLEEMHSTHRVTDTLLDEHIAFLYSTDIFGISDHDLLFTKEAVATEDEISGGSEMNDAIQAKVRRAADIMRAESSQAIGREDRPLSSLPNERKKKNQTKIQDHVEVFIPSREDSTRFKPARKVSQSLESSDVIDLTALDTRIDKEDLEKQFSTITLNETSDNESRNSSLNEDRNIGSKVKRKIVNVLESDSDDEAFTTPNASTSSYKDDEVISDHENDESHRDRTFVVLENDSGTHNQDLSPDHEELDEQVSQCSSEYDEGVRESHSDVRNDLENDEYDSNEDEKFKISKRSPSRRNTIDSTEDESSDNSEESKENEGLGDQVTQCNSENDGAAKVSPSDVQSDSENGESSSNGNENLKQSFSPRKALTSTNSTEDESSDNSEKSEVILPTYTTCCPEGIHVSESFNVRRCPCVMTSGERQADKNMSKSPRSSDVIDLTELDTEDDRLERQSSEITLNETGGNRSKNYSLDEEKNIGSKVKRKIVKVLESDSEDEVFTTPNASTSSYKDDEVISDPENDEINRDRTFVVLENDSGTHNEDLLLDHEELDEQVSQCSSEYDEGVRESHSDVRNDVENDEYDSNEDENLKRSPSQENMIDSTENESSDNSEESEDSEEFGEQVSQCNSENDGGDKESHSDVQNVSNNDQSSSSGNENFKQSMSPRKTINSAEDESSDMSEKLEVILPTYTTCCPEGIHVSESFNIKRCPCVMSSGEREAYKMHVNSARRCEKSEEFRAALKHFSAAYKLCDSDGRLRTKIQNCYRLLKKTAR